MDTIEIILTKENRPFHSVPFKNLYPERFNGELTGRYVNTDGDHYGISYGEFSDYFKKIIKQHEN